MSVNYYALLGLNATASDSEVRQAYRRKVIQYHPDKRHLLADHDDCLARADEVFRLIQEAYETLSCPEKRCLYDFVGAFAALADAAIPDAQGLLHRGSTPPGSSSSGDLAACWFRHSPSPSGDGTASAPRCPPCPSTDTAASRSSGGSRGTAAQAGGPQPHGHSAATAVSAGTTLAQQPYGAVPAASASADVTHRLWLTLEEMYSGCVKQLRLARRVCRAAAAAPAVAAAAGPAGFWAACSAAAAAGMHLDVGGAPTATAAAAVLEHVEELFRVVVQPGWKAGMRVTFRGKGDELPGRCAGDMVLVVSQAAHSTFERRGHDLHTVLSVPLLAALAGGSVPLTTLDGRTLTLPLGPACLQPHSEHVLKGEGMPIMHPRPRQRPAPGGGAAAGGGGAEAAPAPTRGDLHVRFEVQFPQELTAQQKEELKEVLQR
ncbi:hypothetical protein GPECTOR_30g139 [Gonium pectorale]|uniref:J domain-containing protein n=1 Tax=Gonium pectorale TaxID=33097 RepID=A0A150GDY0_GONPE|nr:hypothetical protein GPECTOR_30g139 [Gonium pectorale]|eukprot:KXZ48044.1 hypothetical protein GPECTOR_30g139 [Gonium pectorale]